MTCVEVAENPNLSGLEAGLGPSPRVFSVRVRVQDRVLNGRVRVQDQDHDFEDSRPVSRSRPDSSPTTLLWWIASIHLSKVRGHVQT